MSFNCLHYGRGLVSHGISWNLILWMFPSASHQLIGGGTRWHGPYSRDNIFGFVLKLIYINGNGLKKALLGYSVTTIQNSLIDLKHNLIQHDERQNEKGKKVCWRNC